LRNGAWTSVAGQVRTVERDEVIVATLAGVRAVRRFDLSPW
jgi:hypothetical protein